jgi:hypothetical protein
MEKATLPPTAETQPLPRLPRRVVEIHALLEPDFVAGAPNLHAERIEPDGELVQLRLRKTQRGTDRLARVNRSVGQGPKQRKSGVAHCGKSGKDRLEY